MQHLDHDPTVQPRSLEHPHGPLEEAALTGVPTLNLDLAELRPKPLRERDLPNAVDRSPDPEDTADLETDPQAEVECGYQGLSQCLLMRLHPLKGSFANSKPLQRESSFG